MSLPAPEPLAPAKEAATAAMLARAFHDNPMYRHFVPDETVRPAAIAYFMECTLRVGRMYGESHVTPGDVAGASVWLLPGKTDLSPLQTIRAGLLGVPFKLGWSAFTRVFSSMDHLDKWHRAHAKEPHYYLLCVGTEPARQKQGVASNLLRPQLLKADAEKRGCYLETDRPENVPFYRKHGFDVVVEGPLPGGGPTAWGMWRAPKNS